MGKMPILKTPPQIPEHNLRHAHNIHFTTYSTQKGFFGSAKGHSASLNLEENRVEK
jgi:hypothetical protein